MFTLAAICVPPRVRAATIELELHWTAPGDDGNLGRATTYELRWSSSPINNSNALRASRFLGLRPPSPAGQGDSMTVTLAVTGAPSYLALRTAEEVGNWSSVSNNAILPGTTAELPDTIGSLALAVPVPSPARATTTLSFATSRDAEANIDVFDMAGRRVRALVDGVLSRGRHALSLDLRDEARNAVPAGLYLVRARVGK